MRDLLLKKIEEAKLDLVKNPKSLWYKKTLKKAYNELDKFDRNEEKEKYGISVAKSIFKKHDILAVQYNTTSVRGFNTLKRRGYEIQNHDVRYIVLRGTFETIFINTIAEEMKANGFVLDTVNTSGILIKSFNSK
jgi:hypothetical protein